MRTNLGKFFSFSAVLALSLTGGFGLKITHQNISFQLTEIVIAQGSNVEIRPRGSNLDFGRDTVWQTNNGYKLIFQRDGNLVLYNPQNQPLWATGTNADRFSVQADGNMVLYQQNRPIWATNTSGNGVFLALQTDGNLVVYNSNSRPLWATNTDGGRSSGEFGAANHWRGNPIPPVTNSPSPINLSELQRLLFGNVSNTVTSNYGVQDCSVWRNIYTECRHPAFDFAGPHETAIYSPIQGEVISHNNSSGFIGIYNSRSDITFFFGHMNRFDVNMNQTITKDQQIGVQGNKGFVRSSSGGNGSHLHFEARLGRHNRSANNINQTIDPVDAVNRANQ